MEADICNQNVVWAEWSMVPQYPRLGFSGCHKTAVYTAVYDGTPTGGVLMVSRLEQPVLGTLEALRVLRIGTWGH